ncbi:hypothetical protein shim_35400 [Shimia sp. SK013]|uniref:hypothetical protein n=1 Tax=Shimia sp. SK013 TaxID=1389006 RepID=UPI0006B45129|nr:hypothetical protein [Shimia sp. SK013]KPA20549.1 hypothetical protein shim_35400 [Shimia sp. SK013]
MSCVFIGSDAVVSKLFQPDVRPVDWHEPASFQKALRFATRLVVAGLRGLSDRDFLTINQLPTVFVLTSGIDLTHLIMHIQDGRLCLTPWDRIVCLGDVDTHFYRAPWIEFFGGGLTLDPGLFHSLENKPWGSLPAPSGFDKISKPTLVKFAIKMRAANTFPFSPVVASGENAQCLIDCCFDVTDVVVSGAEKMPPDALIAAPEEIEASLSANPQATLLVCPAIVNGDMSMELIHRRVALAARRPVNLLNVNAIGTLPDQSVLAGLTYELG